jgi:hypothetical protein
VQHHRHLPIERVKIGGGSRRNSHADMVKVVKPCSQTALDGMAAPMSRMPPPAR